MKKASTEDEAPNTAEAGTVPVAPEPEQAPEVVPEQEAAAPELAPTQAPEDTIPSVSTFPAV